MDTLISARPSSKASSKLVSLLPNDDLRISISSLSIADLVYSCRKHFTKEAVMEKVDYMRRKWRVLEFTEFDIYSALKSECPDFEDAIQISIAESDSDVIITNNVKHFKDYTALEVCTPQEFLDRCLVA